MGAEEETVVATQDAQIMHEREKHSNAIDEKSKKVRCSYCGKVVASYNRLKYHLAGIRGNVCPCDLVPDSVRESMKSSLEDHKKDEMIRKLGECKSPELPPIRDSSPPSVQLYRPILHSTAPSTDQGGSVHENRCYVQYTHNLVQPVVTTEANARDVSCNASLSQQGGQTLEVTTPPYQVFCTMNKQPELSSCHGTDSVSRSRDMSSSSRTQGSESFTELNNYLNTRAAKSIGKLIFEAGLEPSILQLPSFKDMVDVLAWAQVSMPTYESIMQEQLRETYQRAGVLKQHWETSGCSVILDSWKSRCGKKCFVSVLVHSRKGMLFLRSMDVSEIIDDVDELAQMLCHVVDEVGVLNIIQVVTNDSSPYMQAAEHAVLKRYGHSFFFTLCADHCINLLLENIAKLDHVEVVLMKAKEITRFIYSHALPMELKGKYIVGGEILSSSNLDSVAKFMTLERLFSERNNLVEMFSSPEWASSGWATRSSFRHIYQVVNTDDSFWCAAAEILKITGPLVNVLYKLEADSCPMGILYDAIDSAKEDIKRNLRDKHGKYWAMVDDIWDHYLHSPLHAAGYTLNPRVFFTDRFRRDTEISSGIKSCISRMAKHYDRRNVTAQMEAYQSKTGSFNSDSVIQETMDISQVTWWLANGTDTPELQTFAVKILSQTCFGAYRYNIDWSISEQLHVVDRTYAELERLQKKEYIHYNLLLARSAPCLRGAPGAQHCRLTTQLGDWVSSSGNEHSIAQPKVENHWP